MTKQKNRIIDIENYKDIIKYDFDEWFKKGLCSSAIKLNEQIDLKNNNKNKHKDDYLFNPSNPPQYFTGDLKSQLVLIHLNPQSNQGDKDFKNFNSFDDYWNFFTQFGKLHYGQESDRKHNSPFDKKQIRFLKPFNVLPFKDVEHKASSKVKIEDQYYNLEIVIDKKLQLELIPYGSKKFDYKLLEEQQMNYYITLILDVISFYDRRYVIFCGRVFEKLLQKYIVNERSHKFRLIKKETGAISKKEYELINLTLKHNDKSINAAIAPQFAMQGAPVDKYAEKIIKLYGLL